uniref:Uncharacterized protein n=1 Tax=Octopus bimaculoides TaxID=37653 RepID=A0A0L8FZM6_OCTBM
MPTATALCVDYGTCLLTTKYDSASIPYKFYPKENLSPVPQAKKICYIVSILLKM